MQAPARKVLGTLHLEACEKHDVDVNVLTWEIVESLSGGFMAEIVFESDKHDMPFGEIVGFGAALSIETKRLGERVWAGVVAELDLLSSPIEGEKESGLAEAGVNAAMEAAGIKKRDKNSRGASRFRLTLQPSMWRLALRTNCRIYQQKSAVEIVEDLLKEWDIEIDKSQLKEIHSRYEYRVQYNETDLSFLNRILEEDGITWYTKAGEKLPAGEKKKGRDLTKIFLEDKPQEKKSTYGIGSEEENGQGQGAPRKTIRYVPNPKGAHEYDAHLWGITAKAMQRTGSFTVHDFDFRGRADRPVVGQAPFPRTGAPLGAMQRHEQFVYRPGAAWMVDPTTGPLSDDRGQARAHPSQLRAHAERALGGLITGRYQIMFETNVLDLQPGAVFAIGDEQGQPGYGARHPIAMFAPDKKMLVVRRRITGENQGDHYNVGVEAVFASDPYRPATLTPKPRIAGVQSAVVVGPSGQEIHTDEFGRVRVQFPWDREGEFSEKSSCWMRVSQGWAGGGFGMQFLPRVGHEVLVGFFDGDPDEPVVVGTVYNATTAQPWGTQSRDNWTKSGIKTDSSPHGKGKAGFNEISFQDKKGAEAIHIQAENAFAVVAKNTESHSAGSSFSVTVGREGGGGNSTFVMSPNKIELRTKGASIVLDGDYITIESHRKMCIHTGAGDLHMTANSSIDFAAGTHISMSSVTNTSIDTGGQLLLNCGSNAQAPTPPDEKPVGAAAGTARKEEHTLPFKELPPQLPEPPGGFREIEIGSDPEAPKVPAAATEAAEAAETAGDAAREASRFARQAASAADVAKQAASATTPSMLQTVLGRFGITSTDNMVSSVFDKVSGSVLTTLEGKVTEQAKRFVNMAITQGSVKGFWNKEARTAFLNGMREGIVSDGVDAAFKAGGGVRESLMSGLTESIGQVAQDVGPERLQSAVSRGTLASLVSPEQESRITAAAKGVYDKVGPVVSEAFEGAGKAWLNSTLTKNGGDAAKAGAKAAAADVFSGAVVDGMKGMFTKPAAAKPAAGAAVAAAAAAPTPGATAAAATPAADAPDEEPA